MSLPHPPAFFCVCIVCVYMCGRVREQAFFVCMCVRTRVEKLEDRLCVYVCVCTRVEGLEDITLGVFLNCSQNHSFESASLSEGKVHGLARWTGQHASRIVLLPGASWV